MSIVNHKYDMRLEEIDLIKDLPDHLHDNVRMQQWHEDVSDGVEVGQMGGYRIVRCGAFTGTAYYAVRDDKPYGRILTRPFDGDLSNAVVIPHIWVLVEARRQGIALILYSHLIMSGITVVSDIEQTPSGKLIWEKLAQVLDVRAYRNEQIGSDTQNAYDDTWTRLVAARKGTLSEALIDDPVEKKIRQIGRDMQMSPWAINNGWCWGFANRLAKALGAGAEVVSTTEMEGVFPGHSVVLYRGKYYDAETPRGVNDPRELDYSKRIYSLKG